eukprot:scaffold10270_cov417-Chaetoceros_neogracile.AAC.2
MMTSVSQKNPNNRQVVGKRRGAARTSSRSKRKVGFVSIASTAMTNLVLLAFMLLTFLATFPLAESTNDALEIGDTHAILGQSNSPSWVQRGANIDSEAAGDQSGHSVSVSNDGTVVAIGAVGKGTDSGHVRVYAWDSPSWIQRGADIDGEAAGDISGQSVSLSSDGTVVAIGASRNDNENGIFSGHVRVYSFPKSSDEPSVLPLDEPSVLPSKSDGGAIQHEKTRRTTNKKIEDIAVEYRNVDAVLPNDVLGAAWKVSESEIAIVVDPRVLSSHELFQWDQKGIDIDGEAVLDQSGQSVSLSNDGNVVAIGAEGNDVNGTEDAGHVRVYAWNSSSWIQRGADIDGEAAGDYSGQSVSLSSDGNVVAIGAIENDGNGTESGHVRVYAWNSSSWIQRGADIDGEAAGDRSGKSVRLSSDGNVVAISASENDGNGTESGHVRVYAWNSPSWIQRGADIDGEAAGDYSGWSVSLSNDGNVVAIGAPLNDGNGTASGHVRVYAWDSPSWVQRGADIDSEAVGDVSGWSVSLSSDGNVDM